MTQQLVEIVPYENLSDPWKCLPKLSQSHLNFQVSNPQCSLPLQSGVQMFRTQKWQKWWQPLPSPTQPSHNKLSLYYSPYNLSSQFLMCTTCNSNLTKSSTSNRRVTISLITKFFSTILLYKAHYRHYRHNFFRQRHPRCQTNKKTTHIMRYCIRNLRFSLVINNEKQYNKTITCLKYS